MKSRKRNRSKRRSRKASRKISSRKRSSRKVSKKKSRRRSSRKLSSRMCAFASSTKSPSSHARLRMNKKVDDSRSDKMVLMISAEWCPYCRKAKPHFQKLASQYSGEMKTRVIDVNENPEEAKRYRAQTIPTFVFLKEGRVVKTHADSDPENLRSEFERHSRR